MVKLFTESVKITGASVSDDDKAKKLSSRTVLTLLS